MDTRLLTCMASAHPKLRSPISLAICLLMLVFVTACSSVGRTTVTTQKSQSIPPGASASLVVKPATAGQEGIKYKGYEYEISQLIRKDLAVGLVKNSIFKSVVSNPAKADYLINIDIEKVRIMSPANKAIFGFLSGRSYVTVLVDVKDVKTNRKITSFRTTGYGARTGLTAQSYGYDDPVREIVAQSIEKLR